MRYSSNARLISVVAVPLLVSISLMGCSHSRSLPSQSHLQSGQSVSTSTEQSRVGHQASTPQSTSAAKPATQAAKPATQAAKPATQAAKPATQGNKPSTTSQRGAGSADGRSSKWEYDETDYPMCKTSQLDFSFVPASEDLFPNKGPSMLLVAKNTSSTPCITNGWPGLSFFDSSGKQIGPPAWWLGRNEHADLPLFVYHDWEVAQAQVNFISRDLPTDCKAVTLKTIKVIAPDQADSASIPAPTDHGNPIKLCTIYDPSRIDNMQSVFPFNMRVEQ